MRTKQGFTLLEMLVVVIVIGILSTLAIIRFQRVPLRAMYAEAAANLGTLADAQFRYASEFGTTAPDLAALDVDNPNDMPLVPTGTRRFDYSLPAETSLPALPGVIVVATATGKAGPPST